MRYGSYTNNINMLHIRKAEDSELYAIHQMAGLQLRTLPARKLQFLTNKNAVPIRNLNGYCFLFMLMCLIVKRRYWRRSRNFCNERAGLSRGPVLLLILYVVCRNEPWLFFFFVFGQPIL